MNVTIIVTWAVLFITIVFSNSHNAKAALTITDTTSYVGRDRCEQRLLFGLEPISPHFSRAKKDKEMGVVMFSQQQQYENSVFISNGKIYSQNGELLNTINGSADGRNGIQIFALNNFLRLITTKHAPAGILHHTSLVGGESGLFFGEWRVEEGQIKMISNMSGHYQPDVSVLHKVINYLRAKGLIIDDSHIVEIYPDTETD